VIRAVLFDLDGTLADTAPDLGGALNQLLAELGRPAVPLAITRPLTSSGARGMLKVGLSIDPEHADYEVMKDRFLDLYARDICGATCLFDGVDALLAALEARSIAWGIVTNKAARFTLPLLDRLTLAKRAGCIVSGDTTARSKPFPDSLLHAAAVVRTAPAECLYVGDDLRDVQAARAAGMPVIAAAYGYLGEDGDPHSWSADAVINHPLEVLNHLEGAPPVG
jgi:2-phosphoglycolate phosphatase